MAGDVRTPVSGDYGSRAHVVIENTNTELDGHRADLIAVLDPTTGLPASFGAVGVSGGSMTVADGADIAQGATADASSANTVIGRLKKLVSLLPTALTSGGNLKTALLEALPAGANTIGGVRVADGGDVALGTSTDSAGDPSVVGQLKAITANTTSPGVAYYTHTFTVGGTGTTVNATDSPVIGHALQVSGVGAAADDWNVTLQASLDNISWVSVLSHVSGSQADGAIVHTIGFPATYLRALVNSVTLGSATGLQVSLLGKD